MIFNFRCLFFITELGVKFTQKPVVNTLQSIQNKPSIVEPFLLCLTWHLNDVEKSGIWLHIAEGLPNLIYNNKFEAENSWQVSDAKKTFYDKVSGACRDLASKYGTAWTMPWKPIGKSLGLPQGPFSWTFGNRVHTFWP